MTGLKETINKKFIDFTYISIILTAIIFSLVTDSVYTHPTETAVFLNSIFYQGVVGGQMFSIFELLILLISLSILNRCGVGFQGSSSTKKFIFIFLIISVLFKMINPENSTEASFLGIPLFGITTDFVHVVFVFSLFFAKNKKILYNILKLLGKYAFVFMAVRAIILIILVFLGRGLSIEIWQNVTTIEGDTLYIASLFQVILFYFYYTKRAKKYLLLSIIMLIFIMLSFRRGPVFLSLGAILIIFAFGLLYNNRIRLIGFVGLVSTFFVFSFTTIGDHYNFQKYYYRYFGEFLGYEHIDNETQRYVENKHFEQSLYGITRAFEIAGFWGMGKNVDYSSAFQWRSSNGIHNAFVQVWITQGFIPFLFYISLVIVVIFKLFGSFISYKKENLEYSLFSLSIEAYMIMFFLLLFFGFTIHELINTKATVFRVVLLTIIIDKMSEDKKTLIN